MEWILVALIGLVIGFVVSFAAQGLHMPAPLVILVAVAGAIAGGLLQQATGSLIFGRSTFYVAGAGLSVAMLAGSLLGYSLTNEERRV